MNQLYVFFESKKVGVLKRNTDLVFSFQYTDEWLSFDKKFPLSLSLKLEKKIYGNKDTLAFFENLLPEGDAKNSIEKSQNIKGAFEFLAEYGLDCAGAVIISTNEKFRAPPANAELVQIDENKIYQALDEKKSVVEVIADEKPGYLSIAGAQDKFPAVYKDKKFYLPRNGAATTHIIKMPIYRSNIKDSVYNEIFCMSLAKKIGFNIPDCFVHNGKHPLYVVARFDRYTDENGLTFRLHQQDFCQAQGVTSEFKYEEKGGPSIKNNYDLIVENITARNRIQSINTLLDWMSFNLLIGNNDSHSKNISLLIKNDRYEIAPMYDLICTAVYPKLHKNFAFKIGGRNDYARIGKKEFSLLDAQLDIKSGTSQERFQIVHELILTSKGHVIDAMTERYGKIKILPRIIDLIDDRAKGFKFQKALM